MIPNNDGSFTLSKKWTREEVEKAIKVIYDSPVPPGERQIKLQLVCPTVECAQQFMEEFQELMQKELQKDFGIFTKVSDFKEFTDSFGKAP